MDKAERVFATVPRRHGMAAGNAGAAFFAVFAVRFREKFSHQGEGYADVSQANPLKSIDCAPVASPLQDLPGTSGLLPGTATGARAPI